MKPSTQPAAAVATADTPAEALVALLAAQVAGDEIAYRKRVIIEPADGNIDAYIRRTFATARLHKAIDECGVASVRLRGDDNVWDPHETMAPCIPGGEAWRSLLERAKGTAWIIEGDVARPVNALPLTAGFESLMCARRIGGGWRIEIAPATEGWPSSSAEQRQVAGSLNKSAKRLDDVTADVRAGKLRSVIEVNRILFPYHTRMVEENAAGN